MRRGVNVMTGGRQQVAPGLLAGQTLFFCVLPISSSISLIL